MNNEQETGHIKECVTGIIRITTAGSKLFIMQGQNEQERKKQILDDLKKKALQEFELSLPVPCDMFYELFDYLDSELGEEGCDDTLKLTEQFLENKHIQNISTIKKWLGDHGGYCDCEVLANIEDHFEKK